MISTSNLPDITVMNKKFRTIDILEVAVSIEELIHVKMSEKVSKYASLREFLKRTAGKGVNSKHRYQALISRILNVTLKGSLQIYKWFRTGASHKGQRQKY